VKQHTSPFEQFAEFVHERAAPPWHWPVAVQDEVIARPSPSRAQHTWVPDSHVEPPHATPPPLLDPEPPLDVDPPLLDPEPPDVDPDPLLDPAPPLVDPDPLLDEPPPDPDAPLLEPRPPDVDPDAPLLDAEPLEVVPDPPLEPDEDVEASRSVPGIRGSSSSLRPHASADRATMTESVLMAFILVKGAARPSPPCAVRPCSGCSA
jgi:hypothetical protein